MSSGLVAIFSVDGDTLFFGDCRSRVYLYHVPSGQLAVNSDNAGIFSNRSPSLTKSRIYFPATGKPGQQAGKLLAINRYTGQTEWTFDFPEVDNVTAQTAPVVLYAPEMPGIVEGAGNGYLTFINPVDGSYVYEFDVSQVPGSDSYASGMTGEISATGDLAVVVAKVVWSGRASSALICW